LLDPDKVFNRKNGKNGKMMSCDTRILKLELFFICFAKNGGLTTITKWSSSVSSDKEIV
jgi:hypothetical protein